MKTEPKSFQVGDRVKTNAGWYGTIIDIENTDGEVGIEVESNNGQRIGLFLLRELEHE